jgi:hypothetical protein
LLYAGQGVVVGLATVVIDVHPDGRDELLLLADEIVKEEFVVATVLFGAAVLEALLLIVDVFVLAGVEKAELDDEEGTGPFTR